MRFNVAAAVLIGSSAKVLAAPTEIDVTKAVTTTWNGVQESATELSTREEIKRRSILVAIITAAGTAAATEAGKLAVDAAANVIKDLSDWTNARENFTQTTTSNMWANNPDYDTYPAAICYNKGWSVKDTAGISEVVSAKLTSGLLHTDYDCMYMGHNNQFYTQSEGGYINLSYTYNDLCSFDGKTGDLTCN